MVGLHYLNLVLTKKDMGLIRNVRDIGGLFLSPIEQDVYQYLQQHWQRYGQVPDPATVLRKFPEFDLYEVEESPEALLHDMREQKLAVEVAPVLRRAAQLYQDDATRSVNYLKDEVVRLAKLIASDVNLYDYTRDAKGRLEDYRHREELGKAGMIGIPTGIPGLDNDTQGWWKGHLNVLGGRLNEGKSWMGLFFAAVAWRHGRRVAFWSLESGKDEMSYRLDSLIGYFSNMALYSGKLTEEEFKRWAQFLEDLRRDNPLYILDNKDNGGNRWTADGIARVVEEQNLELAVIDQASLMDDGKGKRTIRERYIEIAADCKLRAEDTNTPWILLAQVNRDGAKGNRSKDSGTPGMEHLAESDALGQYADVGIILMQIPPMMKMALKKNRFGPKDREYILKWSVDNGGIEELGGTGEGADAF